jgi:hypothetical protein
MQNLEQTIRERAYHLWLADGRREGNAEEHWLAAQRELLASSLESFARVGKASTTKPALKTKRKRRAA